MPPRTAVAPAALLEELVRVIAASPSSTLESLRALVAPSPDGVRPWSLAPEAWRAQLVEEMTGARREGVAFLLADVVQGVSALYPDKAGALPSPKEEEKGRAKMAKLLDQLEDILEAIDLWDVSADPLAAKGGRRGGS
ncbi:hypothetical protein [Hyalangium rubrum]|uniref:Uncharacterized protein n=1 Tax=Hyalangium rubrum TaxID=3103134 RepID=A0ABU5HHY4_9BACT|nr:hypothetical protein [Hyalangium sp. s54d21]MDY7233076.1 hypothetical protein [Hyalangium sp. s54d21]